MTMTVYQRRRAAVLAQMHAQGGGVAIIPTAPEVMRNADADYPYRHDSSFYYLTGFTEPEALLVLVAGAEDQSVLFCRDKNLEREIWDGYRFGPAAAKEQFGFDVAHPIEQVDTALPKFMANAPVGSFTNPCTGFPSGAMMAGASGTATVLPIMLVLLIIRSPAMLST